MSANFTPTMGQYSGVRPFRYWCQQILPLTFDDSLSYMELLSKVVNYLTKAIEDVATAEGDITALHEAYVKLQDYVNKYFESGDFTEQIDAGLDRMVEDGSLSELIQPLFNVYKAQVDGLISNQDSEIINFKTDINSLVGTQNTKINTLEARMNEFSSLSEGSTTGDAELQDIRIGANGFTYGSAGAAVRGQIAPLNQYIGNNDIRLQSITANIYSDTTITWTTGYINNAGLIQTSELLEYSDFIPLNNAAYLFLNFTYNNATQNAVGCFYDATQNFITYITYAGGNVSPQWKLIPENAAYIRLNRVSEKSDRYANFNQAHIIGSVSLSKWQNMTINALGDSITYGSGLSEANRERDRWTTILNIISGAIVNNYGVPSSKISEVNGDEVQSFVERVTTLPDADLNIIFGGTNDYWHHQTPIGNIDSTDTSTFCGALNYVLQYLQQNQPSNKILFVFPFNQRYSNRTCEYDYGYGTMNDFRKAAIEVCARNGVPMIDMYADSGINPAFVDAQYTLYTYDGVHIKRTGHALVAKLISEKINEF